MRTRFILLLTAIFLVFSSCGGEDPVGNFDENVSENSGNSKDSLPDATTSDDENENGAANDAGETDDADTADPADSQSDDDADSDSNGNGEDGDSSDTADEDTDSSDEDGDTDSGGEEPDDSTVELPYGSTVKKTIKFDTKIKKIDVLFMIDRSGLMKTAHENLKANVKTAIIDAVREKIADPAFGLVKLGVVENGDAYELSQYITTDDNKIRNAVDSVSSAVNGSETYHNLALWEAATGEENTETIMYANPKSSEIHVPEAKCGGEEGSIGGACFRENAMPLFVLMTNDKFLKKSDLGSTWKTGEYKTDSMVNEAMTAINARFMGVYVKTSSGSSPVSDFERVAEVTNSIKSDKSYFNLTINNDDETLSAKIAERIEYLAENIVLNVTVNFEQAENPYGVDGAFVKSFYPTAAQPVTAGTQISADITFKNDFDNNDSCEPHNFRITASAAGEGMLLDSHEITVVVPGKDCNGE